jgi:hypothetical protein
MAEPRVERGSREISYQPTIATRCAPCASPPCPSPSYLGWADRNFGVSNRTLIRSSVFVDSAVQSDGRASDEGSQPSLASLDTISETVAVTSKKTPQKSRSWTDYGGDPSRTGSSRDFRSRIMASELDARRTPPRLISRIFQRC